HARKLLGKSLNRTVDDCGGFGISLRQQRVESSGSSAGAIPERPFWCPFANRPRVVLELAVTAVDVHARRRRASLPRQVTLLRRAGRRRSDTPLYAVSFRVASVLSRSSRLRRAWNCCAMRSSSSSVQFSRLIS